MSDDAKAAAAAVVRNAVEIDPPAPPAPKPSGALPPGCPVKALGVQGGLSYFLDANGQLRAMKPQEMSRLGIQVLFGHTNPQIEQLWPRLGAKGAILGPDYEDASSALIAAASHEGIFDASERVRGRGAHLGDDGELVLHLGDTILAGAARHDPGLLGGFVYAAAKPLPRPWRTPVAGGERSPANGLIELLSSWNFKRGRLDAMLLLGWVGASWLAGALPWRPHVWCTGGFGTGKSTLLLTIDTLFGGALVSVSDASAAGVWQKLGRATLPVAIDEMEAEQDNRRQQGVAKLARQAASGGVVLRGGADHAGSEFVVRSSFLFSSILMPPLLPQDRSRLAVIELGELGGELAPAIEPRRMREIGQMLLRRMIDGWPRWRDTLAVYRAALAEAGHTARGADLFGTLLAATDLLLHDGEPNADYARELAEQLDVSSLAEAADLARDEEMCLRHLLTLSIPPEGTAKQTIGAWIKRAAAKNYHDPDRDEAQRVLGRFGLKVVHEGERSHFAIASCHAELGKLFAGTRWAGIAGALGVWTQTLRRLPQARPSGKNLWFAGAAAKATLIPLELALPTGSDEEPHPGSAQPRLWSDDGSDAGDDERDV